MTQDALIPATETTPTKHRRTPKPTNPYNWIPTGGWRAAQPDWCRQCRQPILRGLNDTTCAEDIHVDTTPLTALGEAILTLQGRRTAHLIREGTQIVLVRRNRHNIPSRPAGTARLDVLAIHVCGQPTPEPLTTTPTITPPTSQQLPAGAPAPY